MNRLGRIAIGALVGALLTFLLHPASGRFLRTPFVDIGPSKLLLSSPWLSQNLEVLPSPSDTVQASLWMQAGAELLAEGRKIRTDHLEQLVAVAEASSRGEPENAYWLQMNAVFLWELGRRDQARQRWIRASKANAFNDYQSRRFQLVQKELEQSDGGPMAWHSAATYFERTTAMARTVEWLCRALFERSANAGPDELDLRLATVRNGRLIRDGSRSIPVGAYGAALIEYSCAPVGIVRPTPREQILSRYALVNALRTAKLSREALEVDDAFETNDAWLALTRPVQAAERARLHAGASILTAVAPGVLFGVALVGLALYGLARLFDLRPGLQKFLRPPWLPGLGVLLGISLYVQTGLVLAAAAVTLCFAFVAFEPSRPRSWRPPRMRLGLQFAVSILALLFVVLVGGFWAGLTAPSLAILDHIPMPVSFFGGNTILPSLAVLVLSMLFLAAPSWAILDRIPTAYATVVTLSEFGRRVFWMGFIVSLAATPAAVYADRQVRATMEVLLANEPAHYLLQ